MIRAICTVKLVAGHWLRPPYQGKCSKKHGHNYSITATFERKTVDERGFAGVDFSEFKDFVRKYDHEMLNECKPFDHLQPSAENLAAFFGTSFPDCVSVRVSETEDGVAEWVRDDQS